MRLDRRESWHYCSQPCIEDVMGGQKSREHQCGDNVTMLRGRAEQSSVKRGP
ncbi:unnamed protein product [Pylaiella littoralis]